jgi:type I restriction enzyme, S subunit
MNENIVGMATLGECLESVVDYRGKTPPKSPCGIPTITAANVKSGRIDMSTVSYVSEKTYWEWSTRGFPEAADVLITTEAPVGEVAPFPGDQTYLITRRVFAMRGKKGLLDNAYLLYTCLSSIVQDELQSRIRGSTVPRVLKTDILGLQIPLPSVEEQKAIAHILGTLDDKIELNRKTNETLEAMAKALFKSWFVDFDPVRAKAEGRPTGLPAEISDLFPDSFEDSELGEIPSGWSVETVGEVIELAYGKPLKEEQRNGGIYPVFGSNGVVGSHGEYLVEAPGIVVGRKGNPGTVEWSDKNFYPIDTTFFVVNKKGDLGMRFLFYSLKNQNLAHLSADSAVPGLNRNHAYLNAQMLPPVEVAAAFESYSEVIFKRKAVIADEVIALSAARDALLPKLISGEIRIPDAEKMLEEVGV